MHDFVCVWKPVGLTPLDTIKKFKEKYQEYKQEKISYAGRLDPMAEGILILLIGEENKNRDRYLGLDKEYESEIILGISTDSFDGLGLIINYNLEKFTIKEIEKTLNAFKGKQNQEYPSYSSKTIKGKPLYWWTRNKKIKDITIPSHEVNIYSIKLISVENVSVSEFVDVIVNKIEKVKGDFRQKEVINNWIEFKKENKEIFLTKIKIKVSCSSGTYIRVIANELGNKLEAGAFAYSITRDKVDKFDKNDCIILEN